MNDLSPGLPESVTVAFPLVPVAGPDAPFYPVTVPLSSLSLPALRGAPGVPGTRLLRSTMLAGNDGTGTPANLAELAALALQAATDWYLHAAVGHDVAFDGVAPWQPEGMTDWLEVRHDAGGISTRARRGPWLDPAGQELLHFGSRGSADDAGPAFVRVTSTTQTDGYYPGLLTSWDTYSRTWIDVPGTAPVWLRLHGAGLTGDGPPPAADDVFESFPQGQRGADGRAVYVRRGLGAGGGAPARVTGAALTDGAYFAAEAVRWDDATHGYLALDPPAAVWLHVEGPDLVGPPGWAPYAGQVFDNATPDGVRAADGLPAWSVSWLDTSYKCPRIPGLGYLSLPVSDTPDWVIGYKDGCLVRVAVGTC